MFTDTIHTQLVHPSIWMKKWWGFDEKALISFRVDKANGRVSIARPLESGEYMFYPRDAFEASGEVTLNLTGQAFPFGVD